MAIQMIRFYFVHRKRTFPKPYLAILDQSLRGQVTVGTVMKYQANTTDGKRWQTMIVTDLYDVPYRPRFAVILANEVRIKKFNSHERRAWQKFSKTHGYQELKIKRSSVNGRRTNKGTR